MSRQQPRPTLFPYTTLFRSIRMAGGREVCFVCTIDSKGVIQTARVVARGTSESVLALPGIANRGDMLVHNHLSGVLEPSRSEEHTSELQSQFHLVCRLLLEK